MDKEHPISAKSDDDSLPKRSLARLRVDVNNLDPETIKKLDALDTSKRERRLRAGELMTVMSVFLSVYGERGDIPAKASAKKPKTKKPFELGDTQTPAFNILRAAPQTEIGRNHQSTITIKTAKGIAATLDAGWLQRLTAASSSLLGHIEEEGIFLAENKKALLHVPESSKFADLLKTWRTTNPVADLAEVVDAMKTNGLVESLTRAVAADNPADRSMTAADIADVQAIVDGAIDRATSQADTQLAPFVKAIADELESLKNTRLHNFVLVFVVPVLIAAIFAILNPIADYYVKKALENRPTPTSPREAKQNIRKIAFLHAADGTEFAPFRFVSKMGLDVHTHPSSRSPTIGKLTLGQVVVLQEKRKAWSWIAWGGDEDSPSLQGWVFTRYATKIKA